MKRKLTDTERIDKVLIADVIDYYRTSGRHSLLWRKKISPYRILVSEIMLQQTQVSRVLPKFKEWMTLYPTLKSLSSASLQDVLILWQGLGYQRRAKALLLTAKKVKSIPKAFDELLDLPGVGTYTASALSAFAYNIFSHPVLETNIRTVLIEYYHIESDLVTDIELYEDLRRLENNDEVLSLGARHWYYAIMDYGAYLKQEKVSHNKKSVHHKLQSPYKGSSRELRAKVLFAITHNDTLPKDARLQEVINELLKEGFIIKGGGSYILASIT